MKELQDTLAKVFFCENFRQDGGFGWTGNSYCVFLG